MRAQRTREAIWRQLHEAHGVAITERQVQHLLEVYLALLRASGDDLPARLGPVAWAHGPRALEVRLTPTT